MQDKMRILSLVLLIFSMSPAYSQQKINPKSKIVEGRMYAIFPIKRKFSPSILYLLSVDINEIPKVKFKKGKYIIKERDNYVLQWTHLQPPIIFEVLNYQIDRKKWLESMPSRDNVHKSGLFSGTKILSTDEIKVELISKSNLDSLLGSNSEELRWAFNISDFEILEGENDYYIVLRFITDD